MQRYDGTTLTVKAATSEAGLASASACYSETGGYRTGGGMLGLSAGGGIPVFDDLTIKTDRDANGTYETTEAVESFTIDGSSYAVDTLMNRQSA